MAWPSGTSAIPPSATRTVTVTYVQGDTTDVPPPTPGTTDASYVCLTTTNNTQTASDVLRIRMTFA
ncbi:MAG TPA: hypothetical protein VH561_09610 [Micromonosporaceae bacterium]